MNKVQQQWSREGLSPARPNLEGTPKKKEGVPPLGIHYREGSSDHRTFNRTQHVSQERAIRHMITRSRVGSERRYDA